MSKHPRLDLNSLGNLLISGKEVERADIEMALAYMRENPDTMLGEALIKIGKIDRPTLEAYLLMQKAHRSGTYGYRQLAKVVVDRTNTLSGKIEDLNVWVTQAEKAFTTK